VSHCCSNVAVVPLAHLHVGDRRLSTHTFLRVILLHVPFVHMKIKVVKLVLRSTSKQI